MITTGAIANGDEPAAPAKPAEQPPVVSVRLTPADEPTPALRYPLTTPYIDQTDGNAATFYYRALVMLRSIPEPAHKELQQKAPDWLEKPLKDLPRDEVRRLLQSVRNVVGEARTASLCDHCRWDLRLRDRRGAEIVALLLPEWQELRQLARLLALQSRLAIAEGRFDDAIDSLRIGYKLSRDAAQEPILICGLVGISCAQIMNVQALELVQAPGAPNLYWSLTVLPCPLVDLQPAMGYEMSFVMQIFPVLRDVETAGRTPEQWDRDVKDLVHMFCELAEPLGTGRVGKTSAADREKGIQTRLKTQLPEARERLVSRGRRAEEVKSMADGQVLLIDAAQNYAYLRDEFFKGSFLPYDQAFSRTQEAEKRLKTEGWLGEPSKEPIPIAGSLLSAVSQAKFAEIWLARTTAELRLLEALRMHAARNDDRLPKSLDEITFVPPPNDPLTGKPFSYRLNGDEAVIDVAVPAGKPASYGRTYRVTIQSR